MTTIDSLLDLFDRGCLSRRELVNGLVVAAAPWIGEEQSRDRVATRASTIVPCRTINHFGFEVSDIERSIEFYKVVFGATERARGSATHVTMKLPNSTKTVGCFVSFGKRDGGTPGTYSHVGFGVEWSAQLTPDRVATEIRRQFPAVKAATVGPDTGPRRIEMMMYDPDGLPFQAVGVNDDGWECPGITPGSCA